MDMQIAPTLSERNHFEASDDESQILALINSVSDSIRARDAYGILSAYAPDATIYDIRDSLQYGVDGLRKSWEECFAMSKKFHTELRDLRLHIDGNIAFSYALSHASGVDKEDEEVDVWCRVTTCYSKIDGKWFVAHEHTSVPGDFTSGRLLQNLQPEKHLRH